MRFVSLAALVFAGSALFAACGDPASSGGSRCEPGTVSFCSCTDGTNGTRTCASGTLSACSCESGGGDAGDGDTGAGGPDAGGDTSGADSGGPDTGECELVEMWPDQDGDGAGDANATPELSCPDRVGWVDNGDDCDDTDPWTFPGAQELCDGVDNDCDGRIDEQIARTAQWPDRDLDGFGDARGEAIQSCERRAGYAPNNSDCNDDDPLIHPGLEDLCDGIDNDCDGRVDEDAERFPFWADEDGDGFGAAGTRPTFACAPPEGWVDNDEDCDDESDEVHPDAEEICDLIDNDCDGFVDENTGLVGAYIDADGDGYGDGSSRAIFQCTLAPGYVLNNLDCDDTDGAVHPGATEVCNGIDDNCSGLIDAPVANAPFAYADRDGDGFGDDRTRVRACAPPTGFVAVGGDCDDLDFDVFPGATEVCNGRDDNCNGAIDEGVSNACGTCGPTPAEVCGDRLDNDCDGVIDNGCACDGRTRQPCYSGPPATLGVGVCRGGFADCACPGGARFCSNGTWGTCGGQVLPSAEICNGLDDDCDGRIDEGVRNACGDCGPPPVEVCDGVDNDCDGQIDEGLLLACGVCPGAEAPEELCGNGLDDDCDGLVDEGCACEGDLEACWPGPPSRRGVGACTDGAVSCYAGSQSDGRCEDAILPAPEVCDGVDNDCDGLIDNGPDGCSVCGRGAEVCDGVDNDCDGFIDEGLRNACGQCIGSVAPEELGGPALCNGLDDDCDGLIDEGLLNACGTCGLSCYTDRWTSDAELSTGSVDGTSVNNGVRLDSSTAVFNDLWIANSGSDTVTRINTATNTVIGTYSVGIHAGTNDDSPSRTAIDLDGNAWVASRAHGTRRGSVTKIRGGDCVTDCVVFNIPVGSDTGLPRALAIDAEGFVWVGLFNDATAVRIHPQTGAVLETHNLGINPYGFAIDGSGILWIATISGQGIGAFNLNTRQMIGNWAVPGCSQPYGIAIDRDQNVWTGNWTCGGLVRLDRASFNAGARPPTIEHFTHPEMTNTRGVAIDESGIIWLGASGSSRVGRFNPASRAWLGTYESCTTPTGVGVAGDGAVWSVCYDSNNARRHTPTGPASATTLPVGVQPYSYSDLTGFQLRNITVPRGFWRQIFNCGFANCQFDGARWTAELPGGTTVALRFRTSTNAADWSDWTPEYTSSPATFSRPRGRYLEIEARLQTPTNGVTPVFRALEIDWQRP